MITEYLQSRRERAHDRKVEAALGRALVRTGRHHGDYGPPVILSEMDTLQNPGRATVEACALGDLVESFNADTTR